MPASTRRSRATSLLGSLTLSAAAVLLLAAQGLGQQAKSDERPKGLPHDINKQFADPNVKDFVKRFETESREVFAQRQAIVDALGLKPGMSAADVGAGTGLFTRLFAEKVGSEGRVYAVDIAESFLKHIAEDARKSGQTQVKTIKGTQTSTLLPAASVDLVYLCDVYHHVEQPAPFLESIHAALKPGGRLVIIDFDKAKAKNAEFVKKHVRASKEVFVKEITSAGFEPVELPGAPALKENFFIAFQRGTKPSAAK
ncbi:MAG: methyltransferase domain-containing protein [Isosphaeraceae bacterium]